MDKITKHSFEAVSLLTRGNGMLDVTIIPATGPDWILPSTSILEVIESYKPAEHYTWQQQHIAVFSLLPKDQTPDKVIIIEGNTDAQRIALQTTGELQKIQVRISQVTDIEKTEDYNSENSTQKGMERFDENDVNSYLYQTVIVDGKSLIVPDLDKIVHHLTGSENTES